jgi:hypothetical protein
MYQILVGYCNGIHFVIHYFGWVADFLPSTKSTVNFEVDMPQVEWMHHMVKMASRTLVSYKLRVGPNFGNTLAKLRIANKNIFQHSIQLN